MGNSKTAKWSNLIVTLSSAVFALTALITVYITVTSWQEEREAVRPYMTLKESPAVSVQEELTFEFKFQNVGTHPALNLTSQTAVFAQDLTKLPIHVDKYAVVNDIPQNTATSLLIRIDPKELNPKQANISPYFIVVALRYDDPIINKTYHQAIFLKWQGVRNGKLEAIYHAEAGERDQILNYLKTHRLDLFQS